MTPPEFFMFRLDWRTWLIGVSAGRVSDGFEFNVSLGPLWLSFFFRKALKP